MASPLKTYTQKAATKLLKIGSAVKKQLMPVDTQAAKAVQPTVQPVTQPTTPPVTAPQTSAPKGGVKPIEITKPKTSVQAKPGAIDLRTPAAKAQATKSAAAKAAQPAASPQAQVKASPTAAQQAVKAAQPAAKITTQAAKGAAPTVGRMAAARAMLTRTIPYASRVGVLGIGAVVGAAAIGAAAIHSAAKKTYAEIERPDTASNDMLSYAKGRAEARRSGGSVPETGSDTKGPASTSGTPGTGGTVHSDGKTVKQKAATALKQATVWDPNKKGSKKVVDIGYKMAPGERLWTGGNASEDQARDSITRKNAINYTPDLTKTRPLSAYGQSVRDEYRRTHPVK